MVLTTQLYVYTAERKGHHETSRYTIWWIYQPQKGKTSLQITHGKISYFQIIIIREIETLQDFWYLLPAYSEKTI